MCTGEEEQLCHINSHWPHFTPRLQITLSSFKKKHWEIHPATFFGGKNHNRAEKYRGRPCKMCSSLRTPYMYVKAVWASIHDNTSFSCSLSASQTSSTAQLKLLLCLWLYVFWIFCLGHLNISTFQSNYPKWVSLPACCPCQILTVSPGGAAGAAQSKVRCAWEEGNSDGGALLQSHGGSHWTSNFPHNGRAMKTIRPLAQEN